MIFISHTAKDKPIVEPIAIRLSQVFGTENVFYDSWSIQPGDGIIDKMNQGLSSCKFFFFFVSKNSLQSNMVKLEWQNAIMKATNNEARLIPVKLDDCMMPVLLLQTLYIDVFGKGMENAIRQMIDVINGTNTFTATTQTYENIRGYVSFKDSQCAVIEFRAETYLEPISRYLVILDNSREDTSTTCVSDGMFMNGFSENITLNNGEIHNAISVSTNRATSPGFPFKIEVKCNNEIKIFGLMHAISEQEYRGIPMLIKN